MGQERPQVFLAWLSIMSSRLEDISKTIPLSHLFIPACLLGTMGMEDHVAGVDGREMVGREE